jgi:hypothetical protein
MLAVTVYGPSSFVVPVSAVCAIARSVRCGRSTYRPVERSEMNTLPDGRNGKQPHAPLYPPDAPGYVSYEATQIGVIGSLMSIAW